MCGLVLVFFFFSSRRRHTRSLCDWSSDVCSSDLQHPQQRLLHRRDVPLRVAAHLADEEAVVEDVVVRERRALGKTGRAAGVLDVDRDRKSVGEGKSVDLGGRRIIKKKKERV